MGRTKAVRIRDDFGGFTKGQDVIACTYNSVEEAEDALMKMVLRKHAK